MNCSPLGAGWGALSYGQGHVGRQRQAGAPGPRGWLHPPTGTTLPRRRGCVRGAPRAGGHSSGPGAGSGLSQWSSRPSWTSGTAREPASTPRTPPSPGPHSQRANDKHTQRALVILLLGRCKGAEMEDTWRKLYKIKRGRWVGGGWGETEKTRGGVPGQAVSTSPGLLEPSPRHHWPQRCCPHADASRDRLRSGWCW